MKSFRVLQFIMNFSLILWLILSMVFLPGFNIHGGEFLRVLIVLLFFAGPAIPIIIFNFTLQQEAPQNKSLIFKTSAKFAYTMLVRTYILVFSIAFIEFSIYYILSIVALTVLAVVLFILEIIYLKKHHLNNNSKLKLAS